jgi:hypothetical protein
MFCNGEQIVMYLITNPYMILVEDTPLYFNNN